MPHEAPSSLKNLIQFLIEATRRKAFCSISISIQGGQIGIIRVEEQYKLHTLPIADRSGV